MIGLFVDQGGDRYGKMIDLGMRWKIRIDSNRKCNVNEQSLDTSWRPGIRTPAVGICRVRRFGSVSDVSTVSVVSDLSSESGKVCLSSVSIGKPSCPSRSLPPALPCHVDGMDTTCHVPNSRRLLTNARKKTGF